MGPARLTDPDESRRAGLAARRALTAEARREASAAVAERLAALSELVGPGRLATYAAAEDELDLAPLADLLRTRGWQLHLPRISSVGDRTMDFVEWLPGAPLTANTYGIAEPTGESVVVGELDVVVLPCAAVDALGTRVGFGAGYYDRALAGIADQPSHTRAALVAVAFDCQRVAPIARRPWDVPADIVVTDRVVLRP